MTDVAPWTIRPYRAGDETALVSLFARVFGRSISEAHWRWKLAGSSASVPTVFLGVTPDPAGGDHPVFHYAGIPVRYRGPDGEVTGMIAVDAMTDPEFRRRGLLTAVSRQVHDCWRDAGISFVIGLPNNQWGSRTRALGWRELFPLTWRVRPLRLDAIIARRFGRPLGLLAAPFGHAWSGYWRWKAGSDPMVRIRRVVSAEAFDDLWRSLEQHRGPCTTYSIIRDRAWIEWRYLSAPDAKYVVWLAERADAPVGYCVSRLHDAGGRLVGYLAESAAVSNDATVQEMLLATAASALYDDGAELVASLAVPGTAADAALWRAGFLFSWGSFSVQMVPLQSDALLPFSEVCGGDFDVV